MKGDHDIEAIVNILEQEEYYDKRPWHTPLLEDEENGEYYVIREIYIDEDDDIIFKIQHL